MDRLTQCMLCGNGIGRFSCRMCGRVVCGKCFDAGTEICAACRAGKN